MDALFDSWDPDRVGAIEMGELCKRLRGADVHKGAESPLSLSGRACGKDTSDASPTASRRKSNASAASVQQQKNLERDRKVLFQRKMDAAARVTARREVDRQLLRDVRLQVRHSELIRIVVVIVMTVRLQVRDSELMTN